MCGRYVQTRRARDRARLMALVREEEARRAESWNVAPSTLSLAVRVAALAPGEGRVADWLSWGLAGEGDWLTWRPAGGAAQPATGRPAGSSPLRPINARVESVAAKPFFRESWRSRRCVVPVDGWYEWKTDRWRKQPFYFHRVDGEPIFFAGLWAAETFCLLTTAADGDLAQVHDRRPLSLRDEVAAAWLETEPASPEEAVRGAVPPEAITFHPVGNRVSNAREDGPDLIEPVPLDPRSDFLPGF